MRALIVEDLPESQELLVEVACAAFPGIECDVVAGVAEALALSSRAFELALIDLSLPDGSGIELIETLAPHQPACAWIVATIFDDDDRLFSALKAGAQGYLLKDEPPEAIIRELRGIREGRPPLSPAIARRILRHFHHWESASQSTLPVPELTPREREVLARIAKGNRIAEIASQLSISPHTVGDHVKNIYRKLDISSRAQAALEAQRLGIL